MINGLNYTPNNPGNVNHMNVKRTKGKGSFKYFNDQRLGLKLAKANQQVLQEKFEAVITDRQYNIGLHDDNVILTGGVALNITNNENIKNKFKLNTFVPPNPTDGGLSLGGLFWYMHLIGLEIPEQDYKFSGTPLIQNKPIKKKRKTSIKTLAKMIKNGAILGILEGQSELGPRALGRRSIICDPSNKDVVERLNKEIKHREWYRPFAPIMLEDHLMWVESYSHDDLTKMSYATKVSLEFERLYPAVVHADGTARVQVCEDKDSTVYKLLKEIGTPLLNTSFNDNGKPIVSNWEDAYSMLPSLDGIVVNGVLIKE
jgi:carbamoyltransferase